MSTSHRNRSRARASARTTRAKEKFIASDSTTWHLATVQQLRSLPAETLRLHLSEKSLVTTGNKSVMAQRLYDHIHPSVTQAVASSVLSTSKTSSVPLDTTPTLSPATTTAQVTSGVTIPENPPNSQHLASLLYQAALQLAPSCPTPSQPQIIPPANARVSVSEAAHQLNNSLYTPHSSQQEDQLSEASVPTPSNQPSGALLSANNTPVAVDTVPAATSASMLPPIPAHLRDRIVSGEFIDFNSLLTRAMFSTRDSPTQFQSPSPLFMLQMFA